MWTSHWFLQTRFNSQIVDDDGWSQRSRLYWLQCSLVARVVKTYNNDPCIVDTKT